MKATYIKPETKTFRISTEHQVLTTSNVGIGNDYGSGNTVLSRQNGSSWDDDDE